MGFLFWLRFPLGYLAGVVHRGKRLLPPKEQATPPDPISPLASSVKRPEPGRRMAVEVLETATGVLFRVRGEVGIAEAGALGASLSRLVASRPASLTLDLSELLFISSLALAVLKAYRGAAVRAGARVRLAPDLHPVVREALDRAELTALFESVSPAC